MRVAHLSHPCETVVIERRHELEGGLMSNGRPQHPNAPLTGGGAASDALALLYWIGGGRWKPQRTRFQVDAQTRC